MNGDDSDENEDFFATLDYLLEKTPKWSGTATQLYTILTHLNEELIISPVALGKILRERQEHLEKQHSIMCEFTRNKATRIIVLSKNIIIVESKLIEGGAA
jgi:hypothetical protein